MTSVAAVCDGEAVAAANVFPALGEQYVAGADGAYLNSDPIHVSSTDSLDTSLVAPILRYGHKHRDEYGALLDDLSPNVVNFRRFGSAQAALTLVASGAIDATVGVGDPNPWDTVAGANLSRDGVATVRVHDGHRGVRTGREVQHRLVAPFGEASHRVHRPPSGRPRRVRSVSRPCGEIETAPNKS